jgi:DMSO/TMAO reductase YedYZ molybdopterin-dependent catalytic subunit
MTTNDILSRRHGSEPMRTRLRFLAALGSTAVAGAIPAPALASLATRMVRRYSIADVDRHLRVYGLRPPADIVYTVWATNRFRGYTVPIGGDVERPIALGISEIRAMPQQTQITRLSCVKGWSAIAKWRGVALRAVLAMVRPMSHTRFVIFQCFDRDPHGTPYYESLDLEQARHSQTLLALDLNDRPIDSDHGGAIRLIVPSQAGYKNAKWIRRIDVVSSLEDIAGGKGGYWEDRAHL